MAFVYHQVFADESGKHQKDPVIAFCAVTATGDRLAAFDVAWQTLLRNYELPALHMERVTRLVEDHGWRLRKGQTVDERIDALIPFADLINKHLEMGVVQAWSVRGFNHLSSSVLKALGGSHDPFFLAFIRGMLHITEHLGDEDKVSIIFDDDQNNAWDVYGHYRAIGAADYAIQKKTISLSFADDKHFPGLQAADMLAFLTRQEAGYRFDGVANIWNRLYNRLTTQPEPPYGIMRWFGMFADEDELVELAREAQAEAERLDRERKESRNKVRSLQSSNEDNPPSGSKGGKSSNGSGDEGQ